MPIAVETFYCPLTTLVLNYHYYSILVLRWQNTVSKFHTVLLCPLDIAYLCLLYPAIYRMHKHLTQYEYSHCGCALFCHLNAVGGFVCKPFPILIQGGDAYVSAFITHKSFLNAIQKSKNKLVYAIKRGVFWCNKGKVREKSKTTSR